MKSYIFRIALLCFACYIVISCIKLQIELVNNITFSIYCQKIEVISDNEEK